MFWNKKDKLPNIEHYRLMVGEVLDIAEDMVRPRLETAINLPEAERKEQIVRLTMALGMGLAIIGKVFYGASGDDGTEFGKRMGQFIGESIQKLPDNTQMSDLITVKENNNEQRSNSKEKSSWDIH